MNNTRRFEYQQNYRQAYKVLENFGKKIFHAETKKYIKQ